jgi:hypothetical protein
MATTKSEYCEDQRLQQGLSGLALSLGRGVLREAYTVMRHDHRHSECIYMQGVENLGDIMARLAVESNTGKRSSVGKTASSQKSYQHFQNTFSSIVVPLKRVPSRPRIRCL